MLERKQNAEWRFVLTGRWWNENDLMSYQAAAAYWRGLQGQTRVSPVYGHNKAGYTPRNL